MKIFYGLSDLIKIDEKFCSGLGYIVSSNVSSLLGGWQWGLRVTPFLGALCILFVIMVMKEPKRGEAENAIANNMQKTSYWEDIKEICKMYINFFFFFSKRLLEILQVLIKYFPKKRKQ